jgi:hypothetical protein
MPNVQPGAKARRSGARQTVSDRVTFRSETGGIREGWALNVSRGGVRAILDHDTGKVELGEEYAITVGERHAEGARRGRIVWLQEEPDGFVVGVEYVSPSGTHRAASSAPPDASGAVEASGVSPASPANPDVTDSPPDED